jgi:hypothetical protein
MKKLLLFSAILVQLSVHATTYYVNAARPDDSGNGLGWGTAKKTIQAAVNITTGGDSIIVTNGVYAPITTANKTITIQSVNGSGLTIIDGTNSQRCATLGVAEGETNSVLIGLTLLISLHQRRSERDRPDDDGLRWKPAHQGWGC